MKNNHDVDDGVYDWNTLNGFYYPSLLNQPVLTFTFSHRWSWLGSRGSKLLRRLLNSRLTRPLAKQKSDAFPGSKCRTSPIASARSSKRSPTPGVRTSQNIQGEKSLSDLTFVLNMTLQDTANACPSEQQHARTIYTAFGRSTY
jgi:hypothetical protein